MTAPAVGTTPTPTAAATAEAIVFSDIVGFTEFTAVNGDERAVALLDEYEAIVRTELGDGGRIVKELGDGFLLLFPTACAAIAAVFAINERCGSEPTADGGLWIRSGIHVGSPVHRGADIIGHDVNLTARIADLAGAGDVLVSAAARDAVRTARDHARCPACIATFREIGPVFVKGIPGAVRLFAAERAASPTP